MERASGRRRRRMRREGKKGTLKDSHRLRNSVGWFMQG